MKVMRYAFSQILNFSNFQYYLFNYYTLAQFSKINYLKDRIKNYKIAAFTGFKIQC